MRILCTLTLLSVALFAQNTASIEGRVLDPSGAAVPGATITLRSSAAEGTREVQTNGEGAYRLESLPPGEYTISADVTGFQSDAARMRIEPGEEKKFYAVIRPASQAQQVTVTATRSVESIAAVPGSVSVVEDTQLQQQMGLSRNIADTLGRLVPGLPPSSQAMSVYGQTMRGRNYAVLIDGVPQSTTRNVTRDLQTIDPAAVERVEIVRGATSIYGDRAAGGVINIITRNPQAGAPRFSTATGIDTSLSHPSGSLGGYARQSVSGLKKWFEYSFAGAYHRTGGAFDADGDRIPPDPFGQGGLADAGSQDVFAKLGFRWGQQHLRPSVNYYRMKQDSEYAFDPSVNQFAPGTVKARTRRGLEMDDPQGTNNVVYNLDYTNQRVFGSRVHGQAYHRDYRTVFGPFDGRGIAIWGNRLRQSWLESSRSGGRLDIETPIAERATLLWGSDFSQERTLQPVNTIDEALYDQSGGLVVRKIGEAVWVPPIKQRNVGVFGQLEWKPLEKLTLRGGLRHEVIRASVNDFTTLAGNRLNGGTLRYSDTVYNAGAVVSAGRGFNVFANFSQGFGAPDIGLALRGAPAGSSLNTIAFETQKVNSYELGVRHYARLVQTSVSAYYTDSKLGTSSGGFNQPVVRAPEKIYGFEASADVQPVSRWSLGGTATWLEGRTDPSFSGRWTWLNSFRIPPLKLTAYIDHQTTSRWHNRLQGLYSGSRKRFGNRNAFGERDVLSYVTFDWISSIRAGCGTIQLSLENILNRQYFVREAQLLWSGRNDSYSAARGAVLAIGYRISY
ncbi:MAG: TonB-dependent receptor [Bryobacteraceae bacterium]